MSSFNIVNGQIYTPGLAIVDAPQPNTPLGGGESSIVFYSIDIDMSRLQARCSSTDNVQTPSTSPSTSPETDDYLQTKTKTKKTPTSTASPSSSPPPTCPRTSPYPTVPRRLTVTTPMSAPCLTSSPRQQSNTSTGHGRLVSSGRDRAGHEENTTYPCISRSGGVGPSTTRCLIYLSPCRIRLGSRMTVWIVRLLRMRWWMLGL